MKFLISTIIIFASVNSFGNYRWELERNVKYLSRQVNALAHQNADLLTPKELRESIRKLKDLKATLLGLNRGYPAPVCSEESPANFKRTFKSIKIFAYSVKGPNLSQEDAINYAIDWTNTYPCNYSDQFERTYHTIKRFAQATNGGLGLSLKDAIKYANEVTTQFCGDFNFKQDFFASYKLARYEMNLSEPEAISFAKRATERDHFSCRWDDQIINDNVDIYNTPALNTNDICITPVIVAPIPTRPRR